MALPTKTPLWAVIIGAAGSVLALIPPACASSTYDQTILKDQPVAFWDISANSSREPDLTRNGNTGEYQNGLPRPASLPNGDQAADFNGSNQYLTIPSNSSFSIPTTGNLTWEVWLRPDILQFPNDSGLGYVNFMGKCAMYSPTCEWSGRMYSARNSSHRPSRVSAYAFNPTANLGSGAYWQPIPGLFQPGEWLHIVGEYTTLTQPAGCLNTSSYPGSINIWVNGIEWNQSYHGQTGCMSQYDVIPQANDSPVNVGTMALDTWFPGAIGKLAIYNYLLSPAQIAGHYHVMTGLQPTGSCRNACTF